MNKSPLNLGKTDPETKKLIEAVNELMSRTGYDYHRAWMAIKKTRPELITAVNEGAKRRGEWKPEPKFVGAPVDQTVLPESQRMITAVNEVMGQQRCDWNTAWNFVKRMNPELFQAVNQANEARNEKWRRENEASFKNK